MEAIYTAILYIPGLEFLALGVLALLSWLFTRYMTARPWNLGVVLAILGCAAAILVLWGLGPGGILRAGVSTTIPTDPGYSQGGNT